MMNFAGRLTIPEPGLDEWWDVTHDGLGFSPNVTPKMKVRKEEHVIRFPIFMPTHGRSATGKLDLRASMQ